MERLPVRPTRRIRHKNQPEPLSRIDWNSQHSRSMILSRKSRPERSARRCSFVRGSLSMSKGGVNADALIIGAGPTGAVAAKRLTEAGMRVVVLEQGDW